METKVKDEQESKTIADTFKYIIGQKIHSIGQSREKIFIVCENGYQLVFDKTQVEDSFIRYYTEKCKLNDDRK